MAATQGVLTAIVADASPEDLRGTAFGIFNLVTGFGLLLASALAGLLWTGLGPSATFIAGALLSAAAGAGLILQTMWRARRPERGG